MMVKRKMHPKHRPYWRGLMGLLTAIVLGTTIGVFSYQAQIEQESQTLEVIDRRAEIAAGQAKYQQFFEEPIAGLPVRSFTYQPLDLDNEAINERLHQARASLEFASAAMIEKTQQMIANRPARSIYQRHQSTYIRPYLGSLWQRTYQTAEASVALPSMKIWLLGRYGATVSIQSAGSKIGDATSDQFKSQVHDGMGYPELLGDVSLFSLGRGLASYDALTKQAFQVAEKPNLWMIQVGAPDYPLEGTLSWEQLPYTPTRFWIDTSKNNAWVRIHFDQPYDGYLPRTWLLSHHPDADSQQLRFVLQAGGFQQHGEAWVPHRVALHGTVGGATRFHRELAVQAVEFLPKATQAETPLHQQMRALTHPPEIADSISVIEKGNLLSSLFWNASPAIPSPRLAQAAEPIEPVTYPPAAINLHELMDTLLQRDRELSGQVLNVTVQYRTVSQVDPHYWHVHHTTKRELAVSDDRLWRVQTHMLQPFYDLIDYDSSAERFQPLTKANGIYSQYNKIEEPEPLILEGNTYTPEIFTLSNLHNSAFVFGRGYSGMVYHSARLYEIPGSELLLLEARASNQLDQSVWRFTLDPSKDYCWLEIEQMSPIRGAANLLNLTTYQAQDYQKMDGIWLPQIVISQYSHASPSGEDAKRSQRYQLESMQPLDTSAPSLQTVSDAQSAD